MIDDEGTPRSPFPEKPEGGDGDEVEKPDEPRPQPSKKRDFPGSELLQGESTREILNRIYEGDPLGVLPRCELWLKERAVLISTERVLHSTLARIAFDAIHYAGDPPFDEWVERCIGMAVDLLIDRDTLEEEQGIPPVEPYDEHYFALSAVLGIEPPLCRRAALVFNQLPTKTRKAFYGVAVEGKSLNRLVAEGNGPPDKAMARIEYAFTMMSALGKHGIGGPDRNEPGQGLFEND